jgi:homoserine kinase
MALNLYAWIGMTLSERETEIHLHGEQMDGIPRDKSNLIYKVAQMVFAEAGVSHPELDIEMHSDIPLARGLGSSASAIVGALVAANALIGEPLTVDDLFQLATRLEKHPDNVGASLYGGLIAACWDGESPADIVRIEPPERLKVLVAIPDFGLLGDGAKTERVRHILPAQVPMRDAVFNVGRSSMLVAALCQGRLDLLARAMRDALHQPYRAALIPGMETILREATDHGALGVALSGAGPTLLALVDGAAGPPAALDAFLRETLRKEGIAAETMLLAPAAHGAQILTAADVRCTFLEKIKGEVRA